MSTKVTFKSHPGPVLFQYFSNIEEQIPDDRRIKLINDMVNKLDISEILSGYKGGGTSAFHPRDLLKALFFAYMEGYYSCREIADHIKWDSRYRWLCGGNEPSYRTINRFRSNRLGDKVHNLFTQVVQILMSNGLIDIATLYVDGTTMESRASRHRIVWRKSTERYARNNAEKVRDLVSDITGIARQEEEEINKNEEVPLLTDEEIRQIRKDMEPHKSKGGTVATSVKKVEERLDQAERYNKTLERIGEDRSSMAKTDEDAVGMHPKDDTTKKGPCLAMYNMQIATTSQFVVDFGLYSLAADMGTFPSFLEKLKSRFSSDGSSQHGIKNIVADAGYGNLTNYDALEGTGITGYLKYPGYEDHGKFKIQNFAYDAEKDEYTCPGERKLKRLPAKEGDHVFYECESCSGCELKEKCFKATPDKPNRIAKVLERWREVRCEVKKRLDSKTGQELLRKRSLEPEPVFGQIKWNKKYRRFRHFMRSRILMDLAVYFIAFNIAKMAVLEE